MKKYCYLDPKFPKEAFLLYIFLFHKVQEKPIGLIPFDGIYKSPDEAADAVPPVVEKAAMDTSYIHPDGVLVPIRFHSHYPLRKEFWVEPTMKYEGFDRSLLFMPVIRSPELYHVLVVPQFIKGKKTIFNPALPLKNINDTKTIENFMLTSDLVVDGRAKYAAIYSLGKSLRFNWETRKISEVIPYEGIN